MQKYNLECPACEASYTILHEMDEKSYKAEICPFCGEGIYIDEDNEEIEDWEEDE